MEVSREKWNVMKIEIGSPKLEDACGSVITYFVLQYMRRSRIVVEFRVAAYRRLAWSDVRYLLCKYQLHALLFWLKCMQYWIFSSLPHLSVLKLLETGPRMIKQEEKICVKCTFPLAPHRSLFLIEINSSEKIPLFHKLENSSSCFFHFHHHFSSFFPSLIFFPSLTSFSWFSPHSTIFHSSSLHAFRYRAPSTFPYALKPKLDRKIRTRYL